MCIIFPSWTSSEAGDIIFSLQHVRLWSLSSWEDKILWRGHYLFPLPLLIAWDQLSDDGRSPRPEHRPARGSVMGRSKLWEMFVISPTEVMPFWEMHEVLNTRVPNGFWGPSKCVWMGVRREQIISTTASSMHIWDLHWEWLKRLHDLDVGGAGKCQLPCSPGGIAYDVTFSQTPRWMLSLDHLNDSSP